MWILSVLTILHRGNARVKSMHLYFSQEQQVAARPALRLQGGVRLPGGVPARRRPAAEGRRRPAAEDPGAPGRRHGRLARRDRPAAGAGAAGAVRAVLPVLLGAGHADGTAAAAATEDLPGGRAAAAALTRETSQSANLYDSILDHYIRQLC